MFHFYSIAPQNFQLLSGVMLFSLRKDCCFLVLQLFVMLIERCRQLRSSQKRISCKLQTQCQTRFLFSAIPALKIRSTQGTKLQVNQQSKFETRPPIKMSYTSINSTDTATTICHFIRHSTFVFFLNDYNKLNDKKRQSK